MLIDPPRAAGGSSPRSARRAQPLVADKWGQRVAAKVIIFDRLGKRVRTIVRF